jgi:hypothetical protein
VGVIAVGVGVNVFCVRGETTCCVINASLKVGVETAVLVADSVTKINGSGVSVAITGTDAGIPPSGVGVAYCPHREALPPQAVSKKEIVIKTLISRFTKLIR